MSGPEYMKHNVSIKKKFLERLIHMKFGRAEGLNSAYNALQIGHSDYVSRLKWVKQVHNIKILNAYKSIKIQI